jgi:hypothetical protein
LPGACASTAATTAALGATVASARMAEARGASSGSSSISIHRRTISSRRSSGGPESVAGNSGSAYAASDQPAKPRTCGSGSLFVRSSSGVIARRSDTVPSTIAISARWVLRFVAASVARSEGVSDAPIRAALLSMIISSMTFVPAPPARSASARSSAATAGSLSSIACLSRGPVRHHARRSSTPF